MQRSMRWLRPHRNTGSNRAIFACWQWQIRGPVEMRVSLTRGCTEKPANQGFDRSAKQHHCCLVPVVLRTPAPGQAQRWES
jgi:hypothetical protein